jgi:hypothetical protein
LVRDPSPWGMSAFYATRPNERDGSFDKIAALTSTLLSARGVEGLEAWSDACASAYPFAARFAKRW